MSSQTSNSFPQEIWWLVSQELANRHDFDGLFLCARSSRGMASLALPELYAIHDESPAIDAHALDIERSISLWRSIIVSSLGKTLFPYCCWIKALRLGRLHSQLEDISRDNPGLKAQFFSPPLEKLQIRRGRGKAFDIDAIIIEVACMVTDCIRTSADQQDKRVGLSTLEGYHLPTANLRSWVSGLSSLTSLSVRDGSVLTRDVARAIRANCPAFRELECFFCKGTDVDEELGGFLSNLEPNTLASFTILSVNEVGRETFKALRMHSQSLRFLELLSLERLAFQSLNELQHCHKLEALKLEGAPSTRHYPWNTESKDVFQEVIQWLQNCTALLDLSFTVVPAATTILAEVLKSPAVRIMNLSVQTFDLDTDFCTSLVHQQQLRHLALYIRDEELLEADDGRRAVLAAAIASCHDLRDLETNELFSLEEVENICSSLPLLENVVVNGDLIDDEFLVPMSRLSNLKSLNIYGPSIISFNMLLKSLENMAADPEGHHEGLQLYISDQNYDHKFTDQQEHKVASIMKDLFNGRFRVDHRQNPDELHESDFSD
ncbi:hypothetical protein C7999DRAFT_10283 [Corynascus novoguineensis]|uniref:Uncharacterized protein n=1 Tax=Corynascus novoguineensis TaxID=1126955 RepID=A0AAN7D1B8_9PEZI|nr:hypothetical protein C7999DRAFT_10283 [Corynascus novoguineensis]